MGYNLSGPPVALGQDLYTSSATQVHSLGTPGITPDGREFRYCKAGTSDLVLGNVIQAAAADTAHQNLVPTANAAIGDTVITLTLGASAAAVNQYAGGTATVTITPGLGQTLPISGHAAVLSGGVITLQLGAPLLVAITAAASRIDLAPNQYSGVIQAPITTLTGAVVGICSACVITGGQFGWIGTKGVHGVLQTGTTALGTCVVSPSGAAGACTADPANAAVGIIGVQVTAGASGEVNPVLCILP